MRTISVVDVLLLICQQAGDHDVFTINQSHDPTETNKYDLNFFMTFGFENTQPPGPETVRVKIKETFGIFSVEIKCHSLVATFNTRGEGQIVQPSVIYADGRPRQFETWEQEVDFIVERIVKEGDFK